MFYGDDVIERVREANDIVDVVGTYVKLTRRGSNYVGLCPFHNEKTGSFSVNKNLQIYKCFGCGKAGNVFTFLMEYDNLNFVEAVKELADRAGIALPEQELTEEEKENRDMKERLFEVNKAAAGFYFRQLRSDAGRKAYEYLRGRALSDETMKKFGLGYAGHGSGRLYEYLKQQGFSDRVLHESGIFTFSERGISDKFWDRVIFPYMDKNGKVIAFGGRLMVPSEKAPKYLNSPETRIFIKGKNLYGMHLARHSHEKYMLLCEGYMDTIALHQAGFDNAVGSMGTALTPQQAKLISAYVSEVVLTYDQDEAGRNAILRAIPILKEAGIVTKVVDMTPYKDPDEFIKNLGADEYRKRIEEAVTAFDFEAKSLRNKIDGADPAQKTKFDHELAKKLAKIEDELERNNYIEAAARDYNIDVNALRRQVNEYGRLLYNERVAEETQERDKEERRRVAGEKDSAVRSEQLLLSMLANNADLYESVKDLITEEDFSDPLCNKLVSLVFASYANNGRPVHANIVCRFEEVRDQEEVAGILNSALYEDRIGEDEKKKAFADLVVRVLDDSLELRMQRALEADDARLWQELMHRKNDLEALRSRLKSKM